MKHTCCFESPCYRGWILLVALFGIEISMQMGLASKESTAELSSQSLPLSEKTLRKLSSAIISTHFCAGRADIADPNRAKFRLSKGIKAY